MSLNIGWWDYGHTHNDYCGADGGSNIRIPLLRELNRRGHRIYFQSPPIDDYEYEDEVLAELGIYSESARFRQSMDFVIETNIHRHIDELDVLVLEARYSDFDEFEKQKALIRSAVVNDVPTYLFDRNNWAVDLPREYRENVHLLRPYRNSNTRFDEQTWFPYFYDDEIPDCNIQPEYDLVYIGNRYGREDEMDEFLNGRDHQDILVVGNWPNRDQQVTEKYDWVDFVGSTPHYSTIPLLQLGKATFHVGKPDYNDIGMLTMRPYEAFMAERPCFISTDIYGVDDIVNDRLRVDPDDGLPLDRIRDMTSPFLRSQSQAASQLLNIFRGSPTGPTL